MANVNPNIIKNIVFAIMKISAIICEFNPIHKGHKRLIDLGRATSDYVVCVMSGNFTQRGLPACADKFARARHAILAGADLVVELPTVYATSSAENFAVGGVKLAELLHADTLLFGSECGDITTLRITAELLSRPQTNEQIREEVAKGVSYPKAVANAIGLPILDTPNNVLALEYLKALARLGSHIEPVTLKRTDNYNAAHPKGRYASSTAIRANPEIAEKYSFDYVVPDIDLGVEKAFCEFVPHAMSLMSLQWMQQIDGMTEGIENRFAAADKSLGYEGLMEQVKTKRYTRAKLQRLALASILGITKRHMAQAIQGTPPVKVLAVSKRATQLLQLENPLPDPINILADNLYYSFSKAKPPMKLQVIEQPTTKRK